MTLTVHQVPTSEIPALWGVVGPLLSRALRHGRGEYEPHHIEQRLKDGRWTLFEARNHAGRVQGVAAVEIVQYEPDTAPHLWVIMGAGEGAKDAVAALHGPLQAFARKCKCSQIRFMGRLGWGLSDAIPKNFKRTHEVWSAPVEG